VTAIDSALAGYVPRSSPPEGHHSTSAAGSWLSLATQQKTAADQVESAIRQIRAAVDQLAAGQSQRAATAERLEGLAADLETALHSDDEGTLADEAISRPNATILFSRQLQSVVGQQSGSRLSRNVMANGPVSRFRAGAGQDRRRGSTGPGGRREHRQVAGALVRHAGRHGHAS
jgi:hypothetical protein